MNQIFTNNLSKLDSKIMPQLHTCVTLFVIFEHEKNSGCRSY